MEFFDRKEEVIEVQLTQYGKLLLSKGKLRPFYYAFYDDGVVYDSQHAGFQESQNQTEDRINSNTPRMKTQNMVFGAETKVKEHNKLVAAGKASHYRDYEIIPDPNDRDNFLKYPLYSMPFYSGQKTPTLEAITDTPLFLTGSEITYFTGSNVNIPIPQAEAEVKYYLTRTHPPEGFTSIYDDEELSNEVRSKRMLAYASQDLLGEKVAFSDGNQIDIEGEGMFLEAFEALDNVDMSAQDYELEIFEIQESVISQGKKETILIPLRFEDDPTEIDELCVEQYFHVTCDDEVPNTRLRSNRGPRGKLFNRPPEPKEDGTSMVGNVYAAVSFQNDMECKQETEQPKGPGSKSGSDY